MRGRNTPVYMTIAADLRKEIVEGRLLPGEILPSENDLCSRYGSSRETVRKGLHELDAEGLIYSRPKRGYFVAEPEFSQLHLSLQEAPMTSRRHFKDIEIVRPSEDVRAALKLGEYDKVLALYSGLYANDLLYSLTIKYIPYQKGHPSIEREINFAVYPDAAAAKAASFKTYTELQVTAVLPPEKVIRIMHCEPGEPMLLINRQQITQDGITISISREYLRQPYGELSGQSGYIAPQT